MVDDNFRSYRSRDPLPRDEADRAAGDPGDPLAELARLIGQTDPYAEAHRNEAHTSGRLDAAAPQESEQDWAADEDHAEDYAEDRYVPPPLSAPPREPRYDDEQPSSGPYYSGAAREFGGFRDEPESKYRSESAPALRPRELPAYAASEREEDFAEADHEGEQSYEQDHDDYYADRPAPRRRGAVVVIMAVLGLAVIGTAGAFAYRSMFGGSMLPTLPPIIKANIGPNRITPSAPAANQSQTAMANSGAAETLVPREEQPVSIEPPKTPPRVISTIPVVGGQSMAQPGMTVGQASAGLAPNVQSSSPWPPPPPMPNQALAPAPTAVSAAPASMPAPTGAQPRRIHTVTIRSDQAASANAPAIPPPSPPPVATAAPAPHVVPRPASNPPKPSAAASAPPANAPLSIVPGGQAGAVGPARAPAATRPISVASAGPATEAEPVRGRGGHYAVQVSSQRSEAEAQASFRELRTKFPTQLGGREPIIKRADLGAKGTYYRALVGPFASAEQAAEMCSGLKAAGGTCLVQKN
ncbi:MAG TPA: SPOR domain-containing protein [Xanthobacteraceae bacterium]|nr:SPOR domain-containing protein [Xanthobacteraceae bacterium]